MLFIFSFVIISYIVLHELVHGLIYRIFTSQKLSYGFSLTYAYCGVPNIYVYRKYSLLAMLGPFVVFNVLSVILLLIFKDINVRYLILIFIAIHFSGCIGDLYDAILLIIKFKNPSILIKDTGPKQIFYSKN